MTASLIERLAEPRDLDARAVVVVRAVASQDPNLLPAGAGVNADRRLFGACTNCAIGTWIAIVCVLKPATRVLSGVRPAGGSGETG